MHQDHASRTALEVAFYRALHQVLDDPRIFDDPLALSIIDEKARAAIQADPKRFQGNASGRAFIALRSRYMEDELSRAVQAGVRQCVILGAGLDTFAYRNPHAETGLRIFEVDHPLTQSLKQQRLREIGIAIPNALKFVPLDFQQQMLADALTRSGFRADEPAFFSMLGLVIFLPEKTVMGILEFIASLPAHSAAVFDYGILSLSLTPSQLAVREQSARQAAAAGEPFLTFFDPPILVADLRRMGFQEINDFGTDEANERYFKNRTDGLCLASSGRRLIGVSL